MCMDTLGLYTLIKISQQAVDSSASPGPAEAQTTLSSHLASKVLGSLVAKSGLESSC